MAAVAWETRLLGEPHVFSGKEDDWQSWSFTFRSYVAIVNQNGRNAMTRIENHDDPVLASDIPDHLREFMPALSSWLPVN